MRIGIVAPPWVPVPPVLYGGTEGVIDTLARGLVARGHDVLLATTGDATCPAQRWSAYPTAPEPMGSTLPELDHVSGAYAALAACDVIHDHTLTGPVWAATLDARPPVLATNHGEFSEPVRRLFAHLSRCLSVSAISHDQASHAPDVPILGVVHHGVDLEGVEVGAGQGGYAVFVGRSAPEKGVADAIRIARRAGLPIVVVAKRREAVEQRYFDEEVRPLLGPDVDYLGEVHPAERDRLLRDAVALVNPIRWDEPFGLVMVEALAVGTPVVSFRRGASPEIVDDGVTGFLCDDVEGAARALRDAAALDRSRCRDAVAKRFAAERMVSDYLELYEQCLVRAA